MNAWSSRTTSINWMGRRPQSSALLSPSGKRSEPPRAIFQTSSIGKAADSNLHRCTPGRALALMPRVNSVLSSKPTKVSLRKRPSRLAVINPGIDGTGSARPREAISCDNNDQGIAIFILQSSGRWRARERIARREGGETSRPLNPAGSPPGGHLNLKESLCCRFAADAATVDRWLNLT